METIGLIGSIVSVIGLVLGYIIWLRKQKSPRGKLQQAIEDAFRKQEETTNADDLAADSFGRRNRIKQLLQTGRDTIAGRRKDH